MPSSRAVLADIHVLGLDPSEPHRATMRSGHLRKKRHDPVIVVPIVDVVPNDDKKHVDVVEQGVGLEMSCLFLTDKKNDTGMSMFEDVIDVTPVVEEPKVVAPSFYQMLQEPTKVKIQSNRKHINSKKKTT